MTYTKLASGLPTESTSGPLLTISDLSVEFATPGGKLPAVSEVSFSVAQGTALGILGESGSGKSVTAKAIMGILPTPPARIKSGSINLLGDELVNAGGAKLRTVLGSRMSMVFQDALTALNPVHTVGKQIGELYRVHRGLSRRESRQAAVRMMEQVSIPDPADRAQSYPHQFSGGMRQRIVIAMALALDPALLIADEPTTALDVTVQAQVLALLKEQQRARNMGIILITHDVSVVRETTDRVIVMYAGRVVETGATVDVLGSPAHPYSKGLVESVADPALKGKRLPAIPGAPPDLLHATTGCAFAPRCRFARDRCREELPPLMEIAPGRRSACFFAEEVMSK
ncbi:ABC transporter ATP-binding protein [Arthrobacter tecti]